MHNKPYNKAVIWRGFSHKWTYNHRCNRIGDYVQYNEGKPSATHVSATGLGADSTTFSSYYSSAMSPNLYFKEGKASFTIKTVEKQLAEGFVDVSIPCEKWLRDKESYVTLLNGFDLHSEKAADKMQLMQLDIEDPKYDMASNKLSFRINFSLVLNCQSAECPEFDKQVDYDLDVYYLVAGFDDRYANASEGYFTRSYPWDKKIELSDKPQEEHLCGVMNHTFSKAFVGIKSLSIVLNEAHWLLELATA